MKGSPPNVYFVSVLLIVLSTISGSIVIPTQQAERIDIILYAQGVGPDNPQGVCRNFVDAPAHEYFCLSIAKLVDDRAIDGYSTNPPCTSGIPCFMPYNNVTRGQFSKMLVLYYDWPISTVGGPHFSDVPPQHELYSYIETAYNRGIISGYADGTFRVGNPITRGQMAKMVSNSAGFPPAPTNRTPSYSDVASSHPFFRYIEALVMHAVNVQYPPGAPNQPACSAPPCFFPYNDALRADAAAHIYHTKIVEGATGFGQVFPHRGGPYPTYDGVEAYVNTPDPPLNAWEGVAGPVAVTDRWNGHFIESGPSKQCLPGCEIHPFGNWWDTIADPNVTFRWDRNVNLAGGGTYFYKSIYFGGTGGQWQSQFCDALGCRGMVTSQDLGSALPYVVAGVETKPELAGFQGLSVTVSGARARRFGTWNSWCYDSALVPWKSLNGQIGTCNNGSWTVNY